MLTFSLQSGSNGNCIYVEAGDTRLLIDAGISGRQVKLRLAHHERTVKDITAVLISHDHSDHVRHAGVYERLFNLPTYMTRPTHERVRRTVGTLRQVRHFTAGDRLEIGDVTVHTLSTPHDAIDGVNFIIEHERRRLGVFTDLGHPTLQLQAALNEVHAAYLESNYDPHMLDIGPYPALLKARIRGDGGHLSNQEAADLLRGCRHRPKWVALAHLSAENNLPDLALETSRKTVGAAYPVSVASRQRVSDMYLV